MGKNDETKTGLPYSVIQDQNLAIRPLPDVFELRLDEIHYISGGVAIKPISWSYDDEAPAQSSQS